MKRRLHLGSSWIRFYVTCDGLIVTPIHHDHCDGYGINIREQLSNLNRIAPSAAHSVQERLNLSRERQDEKFHLLFVMGHIDDLMGGNMPIPDQSDPRTGGVDER